MRKNIFFAIVLIVSLTVQLSASPKISFGVGSCIYGDAAGFTLNAAYAAPTEYWFQLIKPSFTASGITENIIFGAGTTMDFVSKSISVRTFNFEISGAYALKWSDFFSSSLPVNLNPYLKLGLSVNSLSNPVDSFVKIGFLPILGATVGYQITDAIEAGLGLEYKMNFTQTYIGSLGVYAFCSYNL